jgi:hypothetical protein
MSSIPSTSGDLHAKIIEAWLTVLREHKDRCDKAITQLSDRALHDTIAPGSNSVAVIMRHLSGNLTSRFTDFLVSDGEKPGRNRDNEFVDDRLPRAAQLKRWNDAWSLLLGTVEKLRPEDLTRTITIRSEPHTVPRAMNRALAHIAYHTGQILLIARLVQEREPRSKWSWVTIAPDRSREFNEAMKAAFEASQGG